jgi:hypothetical protein
MGVSVSVVWTPTPVSRVDLRGRDDLAGWPCCRAAGRACICHGCGYLLVWPEEVS